MTNCTLFSMLIAVAIVCGTLTAQHQNVGIGTSSPHSSAMLDVSATDKGVLVPRVTTNQRTAIANPAAGLLVFDLDKGSFYFFTGTGWTDLSRIPAKLADADDDTRIEVEHSADEDIVRFSTAGLEVAKLDGRCLHLESPGRSVYVGKNAGISDNGTDNRNTAFGYEALRHNSTGLGNTATGYRALYSTTAGVANTAIGYEALTANLDGHQNLAIGYGALSSNLDGDDNVAVGNATLGLNTTGNYNLALGHTALKDNTTGDYNMACGAAALINNKSGSHNSAAGYQALLSNDVGSYNVAFGDGALYSNTGDNNTAVGSGAGFFNTGSDNVFLGNGAGFLEAGSNKLYIANNSTNEPLIWGDFAADQLKVYGDLSLPTTRSVYIGGKTTAGEDGVRLHHQGGNGYLDYKGIGDLHFRTDNSTGGTIRMSINSTGNVHIPGTLVMHTSAFVYGSTHLSGSVYAYPLPFGDRHNMQYQASDGRFYYDNSSRRFKRDIQDLEDDFSLILKAQPRTYTRSQNPNRWEVGYIAEEMDSIGLTKLVSFDREGIPDGFNYEKMILYVNEILKVHAAKLNALEAENSALELSIKALEKAVLQ